MLGIVLIIAITIKFHTPGLGKMLCRLAGAAIDGFERFNRCYFVQISSYQWLIFGKKPTQFSVRNLLIRKFEAALFQQHGATRVPGICHVHIYYQ